MELQLKIAGVLLIILAVIHITFPKYFKWSQELVTLSLINRQIVYVHTFFIGLVLLLMGLLCLTSSVLLISTPLGSRVSFGLGIFWSTRLFIQFFGYSSKLWKGKTFETVIHIIFSILWVYFTTIFFVAGLN